MAKSPTLREERLEVEQSLQFSAQVVQRFYDTLFKIGLFETQFGLGVEQLFGRGAVPPIWTSGILEEFGTHLKAEPVGASFQSLCHCRCG